jgi:hypothetical protein
MAEGHVCGGILEEQNHHHSYNSRLQAYQVPACVIPVTTKC